MEQPIVLIQLVHMALLLLVAHKDLRIKGFKDSSDKSALYIFTSPP
jgi:hypothetical protein